MKVDPMLEEDQTIGFFSPSGSGGPCQRCEIPRFGPLIPEIEAF